VNLTPTVSRCPRVSQEGARIRFTPLLAKSTPFENLPEIIGASQAAFRTAICSGGHNFGEEYIVRNLLFAHPGWRSQQQ
jgi:hypothetical protein